MFNEKQKEQFINYKTNISNTDINSYKTNLKNFFNRLEKLEFEINKEFSQMSKDEMFNTVSKFLTGGINYQRSDLNLLCQYLSWCIKENKSIIKENMLMGKSVKEFNISASYANILLKDENELANILDEAIQPLDADTVDNNYRCFLHLLFAGLSQDDVVNLKICDINLRENIINVNKRKIKISEKLRKIIEYILSMQFLTRSVRGGGLRQDCITKSGYLIENTVDITEKMNPNYRQIIRKSLAVAISQKLSNCSKQLSPTNIINSGVFSRIYLNEIETGEIDCTEYLIMRRGGVSVIKNPEILISNCRYEYKLWKEAFNLA